jgi:hypothetical protein
MYATAVFGADENSFPPVVISRKALLKDGIKVEIIR